MRDGVHHILLERVRQIEKRQIEEDGRDSKHSVEELALIACCYAAPEKLYRKIGTLNSVSFSDPFPFSAGDKRLDYGSTRGSGGRFIPDPATYSDVERLDLLVMAGVSIAEAIDKLLEKMKNG